MLEMAIDVLVEIHQPDGVCSDMWKGSQSQVPDDALQAGLVYAISFLLIFILTRLENLHPFLNLCYNFQFNVIWLRW